MLKTRITERYGLKVPFINAGMAFIATAPLVRAVCKAGGMGMLGAAATPPDVLQAALRDIKAAGPACFGVDIIARFSVIEHIEVCVTEKAPVVAFFWDDPPDEWLWRLRAAGSHIWFQVGSVDEAKAALQPRGRRSASTSTISESNSAPAICWRASAAKPLRRSRLPRVFSTFRISTAYSSEAAARRPENFVASWLQRRHSAYLNSRPGPRVAFPWDPQAWVRHKPRDRAAPAKIFRFRAVRHFRMVRFLTGS
jgi:hypothetical protein